MDFAEYRQRGKEMVDYIADYLENIRDRKVFPDVKPGYMKNLLPDSAPIEGEDWESIFADVERVIMPGITHWQSPHMHAYFPALNSFPSLLGDMLADAINCLGFTWASSPACTELEIIVMNWLGKMIGLPDDFLHLSNISKGGGVIQTTASEATLVCLLAGRTRAIRRYHEQFPGYQDAEINARLVAYCSDQAHSSVEKAALIGLVRMRYIEADEYLSMRGEPLREAIEDDIKQGLVPFWVCATLGTTGSCSFDNLEKIGVVCREYNLWLHVDAAYAGSAFICPEYRTWLKGIERADSIAFNPSKWLMVHFDATALWVKDSTAVHRTFNVEPLYLQHENSGVSVDFMHWQIPLSRRFRALKIWFVLRSYGIKGLQKHIREGVRLAQKFEALVLADHRFEIPAKRYLGLVVFRIKGDNEITERLLKRLNHRGNIHCIPSSLKGKYVIRFTVTSTHTTIDDIIKDWTEIRRVASMVLAEMNIKFSERTKVSLKETKEKNEAFGSSLLLSNCPMSPKIVNGSFAAIFDADEFLAKTYAGIRIAHQESPSMRRRVRGILMSGKQFSLDSHMDVVVQTCLDSSTTTTNSNSYGKTATDNNKTPNPIREDIEEGWEVYESLLKTPMTPPASLSPFLLTPTQQLGVAKTNTPAFMHSMPLNVAAFTASVRAHNRCQPPQTLHIPPTQTKKETYIATTVNNYLPPNNPSRPSITLTTQIHNASATTVHSQYHPQISTDHSMPIQVHQCHKKALPTTSNNPNAGYTQLVVSRSAPHWHRDTLTSSDDDSSRLHHRRIQSDSEVYHGKRYLDPVAHLFDNCSFTNSVFYNANPYGALPENYEAASNTSVDWMAVLHNFNSAPPRRRPNKIRLRISDEHGRKIQSSFGSTSTEESASPFQSPLLSSPQIPLLAEFGNDTTPMPCADETQNKNSDNPDDSEAAILTEPPPKTPNFISRMQELETNSDKSEQNIVFNPLELSNLNSPTSSHCESSETASSAVSSLSSSLDSF